MRLAEAYMKVMDILDSHDYNAKRILFEIAKQNPRAVVTAVASMRLCESATPVRPAEYFDSDYADRNKNQWMIGAIDLLKMGKKIEAIRHCRTLTNMGLKDAKEAVEDLVY